MLVAATVVAKATVKSSVENIFGASRGGQTQPRRRSQNSSSVFDEGEKNRSENRFLSLIDRHARTHAGIYTHILSLFFLFLSLSLSHTHTHSFSSDPFFDERPDNPIQQEGL